MTDISTVDHLLLTEVGRSDHRGRFQSLSLGFCTIQKQRVSIHLSLLSSWLWMQCDQCLYAATLASLPRFHDTDLGSLYVKREATAFIDIVVCRASHARHREAAYSSNEGYVRDPRLHVLRPQKGGMPGDYGSPKPLSYRQSETGHWWRMQFGHKEAVRPDTRGKWKGSESVEKKRRIKYLCSSCVWRVGKREEGHWEPAQGLCKEEMCSVN